MLRSIISMYVVAVGFGLLLPLVAVQAQPQTVADGKTLSNRTLTAAPDDIAREFDSARESFLNFDARETAVRIRAAIASMQLRASEATESGKMAINTSVAELQSLANAIEQRRISSVRNLDEAFARANFALANNHLLSAIRAQNQQARQRLGEELNAAVTHFQQGTQRLGHTLRSDEQQLIQNTRQLAANLIHGMGTTADEVGQGIQTFGKRLEQVQAASSTSQPVAPVVSDTRR